MAYRTLEMTLISAKDLKAVNLFSRMDVYAIASIAGDPRSRQRTPADTEGGKNPTWNRTFTFTVPDQDPGRIVFHVVLRSERALGDRDVGEVHVPLRELLDASSAAAASAPAGDEKKTAPQYVSYQVLSPNSGKPKGVLNISYKFSDLVTVAAPPVTHKHGPAGAYLPPAPHYTPDPANYYPPPMAYNADTSYPPTAPRKSDTYPPPTPHKCDDPVTAYPPQASPKSNEHMTAYPGPNASAAYPPPGGYSPQYAPPPQGGYPYGPPPPHAGYGGYPPPSHAGYGGYPPPPQGGYGYGGYPPQQGAYGATPQQVAQPAKKNKMGGMGMGLGAGLLGGAIGGMILGDMVSDAADGFGDGMDF